MIPAARLPDGFLSQMPLLSQATVLFMMRRIKIKSCTQSGASIKLDSRRETARVAMGICIKISAAVL